jgi:DNA uptake protein ComE-like DNA-binding protein
MRDVGPSARQGRLTRLLRSSYFTPLTLAVIAVLTVGIVVQLHAIAGALPGSRSGAGRIVITGPGRTGNGDQIQTYVLGAVVAPGVYALPRDARVHDLLSAAGGATADADLTRVSLAGALADGGTVYAPHMGESIPPTLGGKLTSNTASEHDFRYALGISAEIAQRLVADHTAHGPFTAISQLLLVPISQTTYDRIRLLVTG